MVHHYDDRASETKRATFISYWTDLLLSGAPALVAAGKITEAVVREMTKELLGRLRSDPQAVLFSIRGSRRARRQTPYIT